MDNGEDTKMIVLVAAAFLLIAPVTEVFSSEDKFRFPSNLTFKHVTSYNRGGRMVTIDSIEKTSVNVLKPIIFIIGGLPDEEKEGGNWSFELSTAYANKLVSNVYVVDWNVSLTPESSIDKARYLASELDDFILKIFSKTGEEYLKIHLIGVALGCEVALHTSGTKINRITCLDPFMYSMQSIETIEGIPGSTEAKFIEMVYSGRSGGSPPMGTADFYIVAERQMLEEDFISVSLYAKSVNTERIKGIRCDSLGKLMSGKCEDGDEVVFGENVDFRTRGTFFVKMDAPVDATEV